MYTAVEKRVTSLATVPSREREEVAAVAASIVARKGKLCLASISAMKAHSYTDTQKPTAQILECSRVPVVSARSKDTQLPNVPISRLIYAATARKRDIRLPSVKKTAQST